MTGGSDPTVWSAGEQAAAIRSRRLSSEELLDLFLARIAAVDPQVNAVCTLAVDPARERCREADAATIDGLLNAQGFGALARSTGSRGVRCTACRSRSRMRSRPPAFGPPAAPPRCATTCRSPTPPPLRR